MANDQPELLALPPRNTYLQQPNQALEELAVDLDLLALRRIVFARRRGFGGASCGGGFLLGDGVAHAVYQRDEEREVDGARDACAVGEVEGCQVVDDGFDVCAGQLLPQVGLG